MAKKLNDITGEIVDASLKVHKKMGPGLYEKVYEDCLAYELEKRKFKVSRQHHVTVEDKVVVELKNADKIIPIHKSQILTYYAAGECEDRTSY